MFPFPAHDKSTMGKKANLIKWDFVYIKHSQDKKKKQGLQNWNDWGAYLISVAYKLDKFLIFSASISSSLEWE